MTYLQYGLIQATDFNGFVGGDPTITANTLNRTWATGGGVAGYGQTAEANVALGDTVTASNWSGLVSKLSNSASHQGTSLLTISAPVSGNTVSVIASLQTNLQRINANCLNAAIQGASANTVTTLPSTWINYAIFTHTVTFANANAARFFFNAGGQIFIKPNHPNGSGINNLISSMANDCGSIAISAPSSGNISIGTGNAAVVYNGVTKIGGGSPSKTTIQPNYGYYGLTTSNVTIFTQLANSGLPVSYFGSFIDIKAFTNGTLGSNGDNGNVITINTTFDEVPGTGSGLTVSTGTNVTITIRYPETTFIANTWGTAVVSGSVVSV